MYVTKYWICKDIRKNVHKYISNEKVFAVKIKKTAQSGALIK